MTKTTTKTVITRFAPSPTGFLHIGGARTALFNWLFSKNQNGKMLLRIEDTDEKRSSKAATQAIFDGLRWLGLDWDDEVIFQSQRKARHQEIAKLLLAKGKAYYCDKANRDQPALRLKIAQENPIIIDDGVLGQITINPKDLEDFVLLRGDGSPTYMLSVVVDDHDMGISHIIRGDDHLTNAAKQILLYQALEWPVPFMNHIPLIHGEDGAKLSKRHGALGIDSYRAMGYLPEALRNYLLRLGFSSGDKEIMPLKEMIADFSLAKINKSPARFDFKKLDSFNHHYLKEKTDSELVKLALDYLSYLVQETSNEQSISRADSAFIKQELVSGAKAAVERASSLLKERSKTLLEFWHNAEFIFRPYPFLSEGAIANKESVAIDQELYGEIKNAKYWTKETLLHILHNHGEQHNIKFPKLAQPLRLALTGKKTAPGIGDLLVILGREESLRRLEPHLTKA